MNPVDLYALAEQRADQIAEGSRTVTSFRKRVPVSFSAARIGHGRLGAGRIGLRFDTYPASVWVVPLSRGYLVELSWRYQSGEEPTNLASIQRSIGRYETARGAVNAAFRASRLSEREIRTLFRPLTKRYPDFRDSPDAP